MAKKKRKSIASPAPVGEVISAEPSPTGATGVEEEEAPKRAKNELVDAEFALPALINLNTGGYNKTCREFKEYARKLGGQDKCVPLAQRISQEDKPFGQWSGAYRGLMMAFRHESTVSDAPPAIPSAYSRVCAPLTGIRRCP